MNPFSNYIDIDYVAANLKEGTAMIGKPLIGPTLHAPVFGMGVPILDSKGTVIGALSGVTNVGQPNFLDKITENHYGKTGGYILAARQHRLFVTATDKSLIMRPAPVPGINPLFDRYLHGFEGYGVVTDSHGVEVLSAAKQIPVADWLIIARIPADEAFAPLHDTQRRLLAATVFLTILAGGLTWIMLKGQFAPVQSAVRTLALMSDTNQPPRPLVITRQDEIGQLIGSFNHLLENLSKREEELKESEFRWKFAIEGSGDGVWDVNLQTGEARYSSRWKEMLGYAEDEILPTRQEWSDRIHPEDLARVTEMLQSYRNGETAGYCVEYRLKHKDERYVWILSRGIVVSRSEDGTPLRMIGTHTDITDRKRAEEEKKLLEMQFQQAQKLESLGVLAGGIAHDFNNILSVILGYCYMATEESIVVKDYKTSILHIETAANRAADLCRQMLTYAGRSPLVQSNVNLRLLVDEVVKMLQSAIKKNVAIELDLKHDVPDILGDAGQIQQIVMNLIINAAEAIGNSNGTIIVALKNTLFVSDSAETDAFGTPFTAGRYVCLEVNDTGAGMDEETQKRIFEPFYTTKFTGRGLGMSAICGIVTAHTALLKLASTPGVGTTFNVYFPSPEELNDSTSVSIETSPSERRACSVLLVEDEETLRNMGTALLDALGFHAHTAQDGREALEIYRERGSEIDLILMDLIMPVMGGVEAYHELRRIAPTLPIIICSGYGVESVQEIIDSDEHARFIHKPYKPAELRDMILLLA